MKIILDNNEAEQFFHSALANIGGIFNGYGMCLDCTNKDYHKAKTSLQKKIDAGEIPIGMYKPINKDEKPEICREDVWVEILRLGGKLKMIDEENEGEYTRTITLQDLYERINKVPLRHISDMVNENDDAYTADAILQTVFFEDIIFS